MPAHKPDLAHASQLVAEARSTLVLKSSGKGRLLDSAEGADVCHVATSLKSGGSAYTVLPSQQLVFPESQWRA